MEDKRKFEYNKTEKNDSAETAGRKKSAGRRITVNTVTGAAAAVFVLVFAAAGIIMPDNEFSDKENRNLAQKPEFSFTALAEGDYTSDINTYISDQFPLRNLWIRVRSGIETLQGRIFSNGVYKGDNGYLFEELSVMDEEAMKKRAQAVNSFASRLTSSSTYVMLVPNAAQVMEDELPDYVPLENQDAFITRFYNSLSENIIKLDVRAPLRELRAAGSQVYYRTDHHWTSEAAYAAFRTSAYPLWVDPNLVSFKRYPVSNSFSGTLAAKSGFSAPESDIIDIYVPDRDISCLIENTESGEKSASLYYPEKLDTSDKYAVFMGGNYPELHITTTAGTGRKILIFKDSYANCFVPFLTPYFSEITMIDTRYYCGDIYSLINEYEINQVLFLYNVNTFSEDSSIENVLGASQAS